MPIDKNKIIEHKSFSKNVEYRLNEEVTFHALGEEPRVGIITNMTTWKGDKIFEVTFPDLNKPKWGSDKQIKRTKASLDIIKKEQEEAKKAIEGKKK